MLATARQSVNSVATGDCYAECRSDASHPSASLQTRLRMEEVAGVAVHCSWNFYMGPVHSTLGRAKRASERMSELLLLLDQLEAPPRPRSKPRYYGETCRIRGVAARAAAKVGGSIEGRHIRACETPHVQRQCHFAPYRRRGQGRSPEVERVRGGLKYEQSQ